MYRRWIIRIAFMLPILLCVGGWVRSGTRDDVVAYRHNGRNVIACESTSGVVIVDRGWYGGWRNGWDYVVTPAIPAHFWPEDAPHFRYTLGFGFRQVIESSPDAVVLIYDLAVPYYFLILIFSAVLPFVWRKTRPRQPASAFPVIVTPS